VLDDFREYTGVTFPFVRGAAGPTGDLYAELRDTPGATAPYPVDVILDPEGVIVYLARDVNVEAMKEALGPACGG
jgi:hypothetical protein